MIYGILDGTNAAEEKGKNRRRWDAAVGATGGQFREQAGGYQEGTLQLFKPENLRGAKDRRCRQAIAVVAGGGGRSDQLVAVPEDKCG